MKKTYFSHFEIFCQVAKFSQKSKFPASWQISDFLPGITIMAIPKH